MSTPINDAATAEAKAIKDKLFKNVEMMFLNNGVVSDALTFKVKDLLVSTDMTMFIPKVISQVVKEAIEPRLVISELFQTIRINTGRSIEFPAVGAITAEDIGEGQAYPEKQLDLGGGNIVAINVTKSGLLVRITEEMINDSQWDVIGMHLRAAGRALARHKEVKCATLFATMGQKVFDNVEPALAVIGATRGVDRTGTLNGGIHLDDLFDMIAYLLNGSWTPNTIIMHPLAWAMFAKDPFLREIAKMAGHFWGGQMSGSVGQTGWDGNPNLKQRTIAPNLTTTQTALPQGLFPVALRVMVSPYVRFIPKGATVTKMSDGLAPGATLVTDASSKAKTPLTDIYVLDDAETGVLVQKQDISTEDFNDPLRDIRSLKIREIYGLGTLSQGKSIAVARNIALAQTYNFSDVHQVDTVQSPDRNI
jgi:hypothetical protein